MRVEFTKECELTLIAETPLESIALQQWAKKQKEWPIDLIVNGDLDFKNSGTIQREKIISLLKTHDGEYPLKYREIGRLTGLGYPQSVKHHLEQLEKKGKIIIDKDKEIISII